MIFDNFYDEALRRLGLVPIKKYQLLQRKFERINNANYYYYSENQRLYKLLAPCGCKNTKEVNTND